MVKNAQMRMKPNMPMVTTRQKPRLKPSEVYSNKMTQQRYKAPAQWKDRRQARLASRFNEFLDGRKDLHFNAANSTNGNVMLNSTLSIPAEMFKIKTRRRNHCQYDIRLASNKTVVPNH
jgi:hypothetical protein